MATDPSRSNLHPNADGDRLNFTLRVGGSDRERVIFFLSGDLLSRSCAPFEHFTGKCIDGGTRRLRLDLTDLHSLDLDGVDTLVAVHRRLSAVGGRLLITNATAEVMSVLRLFGRPLLATRTSVVFAPAETGPEKAGAGRRLAG
jgi:anti-anti-sigma regulatory factor